MNALIQTRMTTFIKRSTTSYINIYKLIFSNRGLFKEARFVFKWVIVYYKISNLFFLFSLFTKFLLGFSIIGMK